MEEARVLERLIKEQGHSLKSFASKCDLPYATLYEITKNGVGRATIDNVMAIYHGLGIIMDNLEKMVNDKKIMRPESTYTGVEHLVVRNDKQMSADQKLRLIKLLPEVDDED